MTDQEAKELKEKCLDDIRATLDGYKKALCHIDDRLWNYAKDVARTDIDIHNIDEVLAVRKMLRLLATYVWDVKKVHRVFKAYESLKFSGLKGRQRYQLTPVQCFMLANTFGPTTAVRGTDTEGKMLVRDATYFIPRKFGKTSLSAFIQLYYFFWGDANCEGYCVANSQDQSKILYKLAYDLIHQLDPDEKRIRFTATELSWRVGQHREAKIAALSAGGKAKDGMFAQLVTADEYGSAGWVKDHSDMSNLLQVMRGSMGPRREPLVLTTTTAGRVQEGPFELRLRQLQAELLEEMSVELDGLPHTMDSDWTFLMALHPDQWETDEKTLQEERVWRKCNPHIGITVQPDYYENEWKAMRLDDEAKREQICKLFNVFQSDRVKEWISADSIRKLQRGRTIDDLNSEDGWVCFVGMDFSKGDDLNAQSYLCYNRETGEFFADMDAWITETSLETNTNSVLYKLWREQGWLRVSPGATINENLPLNRLAEISEHLTILRIGYDAYDAKRFVNAIGAWIYSQGIEPKSILRPVSQTYASYNSPTQELLYMVMNDPALIEFSDNPMWPWEFSNCYLDEDPRTDNCKIIKSGENKKIDNCQCLASALILFDECEGSEQ